MYVREKVRALEPQTLFLSVIVSVFSAIICMQLIAKVGIPANTSILGAVIAMALARMPFAWMKSFRSLERQNLVQTMVSGAGFAASNCGLLAVGIVYALGEPDLVLPMLLGAGAATLIGMHFVYRTFDSPLFPAAGAWPPGIATAQALIAGDEGGKKAIRLLQGVVAGMAGSYFKLPMAAIGIVFIANIFAMSALGAGLLVRGYSLPLFGVDLGKTYIPHGVMIGAGLVSLLQAFRVIFARHRTVCGEAATGEGVAPLSVTAGETRRAIAVHVLLFGVGALVLALAGGLLTTMSLPTLLLWLAWATFSASVAPILVGLSAMHSGWFPAFAISIIFLSLGLFMGFPAKALALLVGYIACTGPCFADMGYDLKTGWFIRGYGSDASLEREGRKQQVIAEMVGGVIAMLVVYLLMDMHFRLDLLAPVSRVFAATVGAGANPSLLRELALWAVPGMLIQFVGGPGRAMGILFATGLLINNPVYGIGVMVAVGLRLLFGKEWMDIREAGLIAGDGLYGFFSSLVRIFV